MPSNDAGYHRLRRLPLQLHISRISFGKDDYHQSFQINFNTEKVSQLQEKSEDTYVVPCQMTTESNAIATADANKLVSLIAPTVKEPYLELNKKGLVAGENRRFGNYAIPIRLASVSKYKINPAASTMLYPVIFQPNDITGTD